MIFSDLPAALNIAIFVLSSAVVWISGVRLSAHAKSLSDRLGGRQALVGILLLGGIVSLPEMATSVSAAFLGNAPFAINTLLGGIAVTMVILAIVDGIVGFEPLSVDIAHPVVLLQGVFVIIFLGVAAAGLVAGDRYIPGSGIGFWTGLLLVFYFLFIMLIKRYERSDPWVPKDVAKIPQPEDGPRDPSPTRQIALRVAVSGTAIVTGGFLLAGSGEVLAEYTGLGASFFGLVLGGFATSLPELSTLYSAVRLRQYEMAFADTFGTNLFSTMLLFFADAAYPSEPILNAAGRFSLFSILLGITMTAVFLAGLLIRRNYSICKMGVDSIIVVAIYLLGLAVLYHMR